MYLLNPQKACAEKADNNETQNKWYKPSMTFRNENVIRENLHVAWRDDPWNSQGKSY